MKNKQYLIYFYVSGLKQFRLISEDQIQIYKKSLASFPVFSLYEIIDEGDGNLFFNDAIDLINSK